MPYPRLRLPVLCVSLLVPAMTRAQAPAGAPTEAAEAQRRGAARALYGERRYREAAQAYEALWRDTGAAKYRFNAGMAREAAEHYGAALLHWQAYLATGSASVEERRMLEQRITATSAQLQRVHVRVEGELPGPATLTLHAPDPAPQGARDPIELPVQPDLDLSLEPGAWRLSLQVADRPPVESRFDLTTGGASPTLTLGLPTTPAIVTPPPPPVTVPVALTVTITPERALARGVTLQWSGQSSSTSARAGASPSPSPDDVASVAGSQVIPGDTRSPITLRLPAGAYSLRARAPGFDEQTVALALDAPRQLDLHLRRDAAERARLGLGFGLGGAALVLGSVGAGFIARGAREFADLRRIGALPDCGTPERCSAGARAAQDLSSGLALLGSGVGSGIVAATVGARASERALKIEAGVGSAMFVAGLIWYVAEIHGPYTLQQRARDHVAATMLGGGAGLLGAAAISLVTRGLIRRKHPVHALNPALSPTSVGLTWNARF